MLLSTGERQSLRAVRHGDQRPRPPCHLPHRLPGRDRDRHVAYEGPHPRGSRRPHPRGARRGLDRARRGLPGRLDRARRDDARPRRLRHDRRRARGGDRRRRSARSTPTSPASSAPTRGSSRTHASCRRLLRGDARDVGLRRRRPAAALRRVRAQPRRADPLPVELRRRGRYRCGRRGGDHGAPPRSPPSPTPPGKPA